MYLEFAVEIPHPTQERLKLPIHRKMFCVELLTPKAPMTCPDWEGAEGVGVLN